MAAVVFPAAALIAGCCKPEVERARISKLHTGAATHASLDFQETLLCGRLRSSAFPLFMLLAFEAGGLLRAAILLICFPLVLLLGQEAGVRLMAFVAFFRMPVKDVEWVARAVMPKFLLQSLDMQGFQLLHKGLQVVVGSSVIPRVMVDVFLREYLGLHGADIAGLPEMEVLPGGDRFSGFMVAPKQDNLLEERMDSTGTATAVKYPKPVIFHDGRLAFLPTASRMLAFFLYLPLGAVLAVTRIILGLLLPYKSSYFFAALTGLRYRVVGSPPAPPAKKKGLLYVCTHRTLLDPVMLAFALQRSVPAVTYSLSRVSELLSPIRTVRLTRDRAKDAATMERLLSAGELAVCPEGTTCREPYLLRFSPLFAELADEMEQVAIDARSGMVYGTSTASGRKWLDPLVFMANPWPEYRVEFLGRVPAEETRAAGLTGVEVANRIQRRLGEAMGFQCTQLTRRDKYRMLAGNDGVVGGAKA